MSEKRKRTLKADGPKRATARPAVKTSPTEAQWGAAAVDELTERWAPIAWKTRGARPRAPVLQQLSEALELAALVDTLPPCDLLPSTAAADLRQISAVCRRLHASALRKKEERLVARDGQRLRREARQWIARLAAALRFLEEMEPDPVLAKRVSKIDTRARSEDALALVVRHCADLVRLYEAPLCRLDPDFRDWGSKVSLSAELYELSSRRASEWTDKRALYQDRDHFLVLLSSRVRATRRALCFTFHNRPEILAAARSEYLRDKRQGRTAERGARQRLVSETLPEDSR